MYTTFLYRISLSLSKYKYVKGLIEISVNKRYTYCLLIGYAHLASWVEQYPSWSN